MNNDKFLKFSISFLSIYMFWWFLFSKTVIVPGIAVYVCFIGLLVLFGICLIRSSKISVNCSALLWIPFLIYRILSYVMITDFEHVSYWTVCLFLILIAGVCDIQECFNPSIFFVSGILALLGIGIQVFIPTFYYAYVVNFFTESTKVINWAVTEGYAGITFQLEMTAVILLTAEAVVLYFMENKHKLFTWRNILLVLIVLGIFLTGKRLMSIMAIILPLFCWMLTKKGDLRKILIFIVIVGILFVGFMYLWNNPDSFADSDLLRRLSNSIQAFKAGEDVTSGRSYLQSKAVKIFQAHPVFGIGVDQYKIAAGVSTDVHNSYLQVLCEMGVIGFIFYVIPILWCLLFSVIKFRKMAFAENEQCCLRFSIYIQMFFVINGLTENTNSNISDFFIYFLAVALMISVTSVRPLLKQYE